MLSPVHVHLMLNHIPVLGMVFTSLLLAYALIRDQAELRKAALALFILLALVTPAVYLSGEGAEEGVEHLAGVSEAAIEDPPFFCAPRIPAAKSVMARNWITPEPRPHRSKKPKATNRTRRIKKGLRGPSAI